MTGAVRSATPSVQLGFLLQAGCPSCRPTNSVKVLKAKSTVAQKRCILGLYLLPKLRAGNQTHQKWSKRLQKHSPGGCTVARLAVTLCSVDSGPAEISDNCCVSRGLAAFNSHDTTVGKRMHTVSPLFGRSLVSDAAFYRCAAWHVCERRRTKQTTSLAPSWPGLAWLPPSTPS